MENTQEIKEVKDIISNETPLRKRYRENIQVYKNNIGLYQEKNEEITNKYANKLWWNNFWTKMHWSDVGIFTCLPLLLGIVVAATSPYMSELIFVLSLSPILGGFNVLLALNSKRKRRKIMKEIAEERDIIKEKYWDKAQKQMEDTSKLVIDLMIEEEMGEELKNFKETHSREDYKAYYKDCVLKYENLIKENKADKTPHSIVAFYDNWHAQRTGESHGEVSHEERLALAEYKSKHYGKNARLEKIKKELEKAYKNEENLKQLNQEEQMTM